MGRTAGRARLPPRVPPAGLPRASLSPGSRAHAGGGEGWRVPGLDSDALWVPCGRGHYFVFLLKAGYEKGTTRLGESAGCGGLGHASAFQGPALLSQLAQGVYLEIGKLSPGRETLDSASPGFELAQSLGDRVALGGSFPVPVAHLVMIVPQKGWGGAGRHAQQGSSTCTL